MVNPEQTNLGNNLFEDNPTHKDYDLMMIGTKCESLALQTEDRELAQSYFDRAIEVFTKVKNNRNSDVTAKILTGCLLELTPIVRPLVVDKDMPEVETVSKVHRSIVNHLYKELAKLSERDRRKLEQVSAVFVAMELLHYWQVNNYGRKDWLALPVFMDKPLDEMVGIESIASQGHLNVFELHGTILEPTFKVHISLDRSEDVSYLDDDVATVWFYDDLRLDSEETVTTEIILNEFYRKLHSRLDQRSVKLLNTIDERTPRN